MKYPKKHKTTSPKHREDFVYVEKPGEDFTALKLISGPYASITYKYGNVAFAPESEKQPDGTLPMKFDYTIKQNPNNLDLNENVEFLNYIGDLLIEILEQQLKDGTAVIA